MADTLSPADILHLEMLEDKVKKQEQQVQAIMEKLQTLDMLPMHMDSLRSEIRATLSEMQAEMQASLRQIFELLHQVPDEANVAKSPFAAVDHDIPLDSHSDGLKSEWGNNGDCSKIIELNKAWLIEDPLAMLDTVPFILPPNDCLMGGVPKMFEKMRPRVKMKQNHAVVKTMSFKRRARSTLHWNGSKVDNNADEDHRTRERTRAESVSSMLAGILFNYKSTEVSQMASAEDLFTQISYLGSGNGPFLHLSTCHQLGECNMHKYATSSLEPSLGVLLSMGRSLPNRNDNLAKEIVVDFGFAMGINMTCGMDKRSDIVPVRIMVFPKLNEEYSKGVAFFIVKNNHWIETPAIRMLGTQELGRTFTAFVDDSKPRVKMKRNHSFIVTLLLSLNTRIEVYWNLYRFIVIPHGGLWRWENQYRLAILDTLSKKEVVVGMSYFGIHEADFCSAIDTTYHCSGIEFVYLLLAYCLEAVEMLVHDTPRVLPLISGHDFFWMAYLSTKNLELYSTFTQKLSPFVYEGFGNFLSMNIVGFSKNYNLLDDGGLLMEGRNGVVKIPTVALVNIYEKYFSHLTPNNILVLFLGFLFGHGQRMGIDFFKTVGIIVVWLKGIHSSVWKLYVQCKENKGTGVNLGFTVHEHIDRIATNVLLNCSVACVSFFLFVTALEQEYKSDIFKKWGISLSAVHGIIKKRDMKSGREQYVVVFTIVGIGEQELQKIQQKCDTLLGTQPATFNHIVEAERAAKENKDKWVFIFESFVATDTPPPLKEAIKFHAFCHHRLAIIGFIKSKLQVLFGGLTTLIKELKVLNFKPLENELKDPANFTKYNCLLLLHMALQALDVLIAVTGSFPDVGFEKDFADESFMFPIQSRVGGAQYSYQWMAQTWTVSKLVFIDHTCSKPFMYVKAEPPDDLSSSLEAVASNYNGHVGEVQEYELSCAAANGESAFQSHFLVNFTNP